MNIEAVFLAYMSLESIITNPFSDDRSADSITGISELICMGRYYLGPEKITGISEIPV